MILWIIHNLRGYLLLKFEGVYSESILTNIATEKIGIWDLKYKNGALFCKIFAKDFKRLRIMRRNTGIKIKILKKRGFPFFIRRYKNRLGLIIGAVIFFLILQFLSTFIWIININGNSSIPASDILLSLKEIGVNESMAISNIDSKIMAQKLLINRNDLAWASLNIEGCVLNVNVTEIKKSKQKKEQLPSNILASKDGIIRKIDALAGDVRVNVGENVHKGDVLISGIIENMSSTVFVRADGQIIAQVEEKYTLRADFIQKVNRSTGVKKNDRVLQILCINIPLFLENREKQADVTYKCSQLQILGNKVPLKCYQAEYRFYETKRIVFNENELKSQLLKRLNAYLDKRDIAGYIPLSTEYKTDNECVILSHRYLCDENIAAENEILVSQKIDKE